MLTIPSGGQGMIVLGCYKTNVQFRVYPHLLHQVEYVNNEYQTNLFKFHRINMCLWHLIYYKQTPKLSINPCNKESSHSNKFMILTLVS